MLRADSAFFSQDFQVPSQKRGVRGQLRLKWGEWSPRAAEEPLARAATAEESVADARGEFANAHSPPVSEQRVKGHELR